MRRPRVLIVDDPLLNIELGAQALSPGTRLPSGVLTGPWPENRSSAR